jgi:hypothetical protein
LQKYLSLPEDDKFSFEDIPESHLWLTEKIELSKKEKKQRNQIPRWGAALAGALAMFVFMLTPIGSAVSNLVYNINIYYRKRLKIGGYHV